MKVAITGHTRGIGKKISEYFSSLGHEIVGFSRSTGCDLSIEENKQSAIQKIIDCDVFVNNAFVSIEKTYSHYSYIPIEILFEVHKAWKDNSEKKIFVISSSTHWSLLMAYDYGYAGYQVHKMALDQAAFLLSHAHTYPRLHLLKPGRVNTDLTKNRMGSRMQTSDVISVIDFCMNHSKMIYTREITFDPGSDYL
jgi:NAD(P)-dependent dehydrogenase (short-subunit alcohol dehydrogenase family)